MVGLLGSDGFGLMENYAATPTMQISFFISLIRNNEHKLNARFILICPENAKKNGGRFYQLPCRVIADKKPFGAKAGAAKLVPSRFCIWVSFV